jgi:uncharacterized membrane protein YqaE (UPF0057 family)
MVEAKTIIEILFIVIFPPIAVYVHKNVSLYKARSNQSEHI